MSKKFPELFVSVERVVPTTSQTIFDLLADPCRHSEIDGSGSVKSVLSSAPQRLTLGAKFGMSMKLGVPYKITNTVVEFEEGKQIAWRHFGGHIWRYILEPIGDGSQTKVTEQFDGNSSKLPVALKLQKAHVRNKKSIESTLDNLVRLFS
jgi:hypothetical protein